MSLHQSSGSLVVPSGVFVLHFVEDIIKSPAIGDHKIGCCKVVLLGPLLSLSVKFGGCTSYSCSLRNSDKINFLLDDLAMQPDGGSDRLDDVNTCLELLQVVIF